MEYIAKDLIGEFHPASSKGNRYELTAVCMLRGLTFCMPIPSKCTEDIVNAYLNHICCIFDPWKENPNEQWDRIQKQVMDRSIQETQHGTEPYTHLLLTMQWQNRGIPQISECNHRQTAGKPIRMGWSCMENQHSIQLLSNIIITSRTILPHVWKRSSCKTHPTINRKHEIPRLYVCWEVSHSAYPCHHRGTDEGTLNVELIKRLFHVVTFNLNKARITRDANKPRKHNSQPEILKPGDNILVRYHTSKAFQPIYIKISI